MCNEELFRSGLLNFKYDVFDVNHHFTKEDLVNSQNVTSAIFLLDQKIDALEFLNRIKAIALFFNSLTEEETRAIKHWIKNTVAEQLAESAIKILEAKKEDVEFMVANNAFILEEMKEKAKAEGKVEGRAEGRLEGEIKARQEDIVENLNELGSCPEELKCKIYSEINKEVLKKWARLAIKSASIKEFIDLISLDL